VAVDTEFAPLTSVEASGRLRRARAFGTSLLAVLGALAVGAVILLVAGANPLAAYREMVRGAIGSRFAVSQLLVETVPLLIIGLGLALAFRGRVWNIGAEGQFYLGALAGGTVAIVFPGSVPLLVIPVVLLAGAAAGAAWGWIAGEVRSRWGVSEIITSLLLNYVAIYWYGYFIRKPLRDPSGFLPQSKEIPAAAQLPDILGLQAHAGLIIAVGLVPIMAYIMARTPFGFRVTAMGLNREAAAGAAGVDTGRGIVRLMLISGGFAGLAGVVQILGVQLRLQNGISPGFGFTAIVVALLGRTRPIGVLFAALLIAGLSVGGQAMQLTQGVPIAAVLTIEALFVLFLLVADKLVRR
jgi:simple sugar transport system permease protein